MLKLLFLRLYILLQAQIYLLQKFVQGIISCLITGAFFSQYIVKLLVFFLFILILSKTTVAFRKNIMYNRNIKGGFRHAVSEKD